MNNKYRSVYGSRTNSHFVIVVVVVVIVIIIIMYTITVFYYYYYYAVKLSVCTVSESNTGRIA